MTALSHLQATVHPRGALEHARARLTRQPGTIAYLGSSVTVQREGYRPQLHELLCELWSHRHRAVNAGTGALGSLAGVFLMDDLVLAHHPDLCFVEYSTADIVGMTPAHLVGPAVEGIVRKLLDHGCDTCFLHLYRSDVEFSLAREVVQEYELVAEHYGVTSVDVASAVQDLVLGAAVKPEQLLRDVVHTNSAGAKLVAEAIARGLSELPLEKTSALPPDCELYSRSFRDTHVLPVEDDWILHPEAARRRQFRFSYEYVELRLGNPLECVLEAELVGIVVIVGPTSGVIELRCDGRTEEFLLLDRWCDYERLSAIIFPAPCHAGRPVSIELVDKPIVAPEGLPESALTPNVSRSLKVIGLMLRR